MAERVRMQIAELPTKVRARFFHAYYDCYCYLPFYVFCGRHLLVAKLRSAATPHDNKAFPAVLTCLGIDQRDGKRGVASLIGLGSRACGAPQSGPEPTLRIGLEASKGPQRDQPG
jgi:Transposase DDE domain group 1